MNNNLANSSLLKYYNSLYCHRKILLILYVIALASIPLLYVLITSQIWEDFFITFKYSENLANGLGLVYERGDKVHGFTSPINTLLLSISYLLSNKSGYLDALNLYRLISIIAYTTGISYFILRIAKTKDVKFLSVVFLCAFLLFETKSIVYTSNGQETGFVILFFLPLLAFLTDENLQKKWGIIGCLFAGLMYARPDGFIYIASLGLSIIIFSPNRKELALKYFPRYILVSVILYIPWIIWAWSYYGSPIPQTVIAKSNYLHDFQPNILDLPVHLIKHFIYTSTEVFMPIYFGYGGWPSQYLIFSFCLGIFSLTFWALPTRACLPRITSLSFTLLCIYLTYVSVKAVVFPWYFPVLALLGYITIALGLPSFIAFIRLPLIAQKPIIFISNLIILFMSTSLLVETTLEMQVQQKVIENNHRKQIGLWLNKVVNADETIYLEPLGYIGYFSKKKVLDYPGLVSPAVTDLTKHPVGLTYDKFLFALKPDWLVLRPSDYALLQQTAQSKLYNASSHYMLVRIFDVSEQLSHYSYIYGMGYLQYDSKFYVLKLIK